MAEKGKNIKIMTRKKKRKKWIISMSFLKAIISCYN